MAPIRRPIGLENSPKQLSGRVRDHLDEEEHGTFQLAGKLLSKPRQRQLAIEYRAEYAKRGGPYAG